MSQRIDLITRIDLIISCINDTKKDRSVYPAKSGIYEKRHVVCQN